MKTNKSWSLKWRLSGLSASILAGVVCIGSLGLYSTFTLSNSLDEVLKNRLPLVRNITLADMVHDGVRGTVANAMLGLASQDQTKIESTQGELDDFQKNAASLFQKIQALELDTETRNLAKKAEEDLNGYFTAAQTVLNAAKSKDVGSASSSDKIF